MLDLSFLLGGGGGVQLPDPVRAYGSAMSLAQLARQNRLGSMAETEANRRREEEDAYRAALPALLQGNFSPEAVLAAVQSDPRAGGMVVSEAEKRAKTRADLAKTEAGTAKDRVDAAAKAFDHLGGVAYGEAQQPDRLSLSRVNAIAQRIGIPLPAFSGDPEDSNAVQQYLTSIANAGYAVKDQVAAKQKDRDFGAGEVEKLWRRQFDTGKQEETVRHNKTSEGLTAQGQRVTMRGQDLLSDRAKEANEIAARAVSPAALQSLAQNEVTLAKIEKARALVKANPNAVGLANYLPDAVRQRTDPQGVTARAIIADIAGQKIHDRSGAAVTVGEAERLRPYVPNLTDDDKTVAKKLELFDAEYRQIQHELSQGKSLADVVRQRQGEVGGKIGASPAGGGVLKPNADGSFDYKPGGR